MGKNKRGGWKGATGVFKVAGAKSLKKTKSKAVQLGLKNVKNINKKVEEVDAQFIALSKQPPLKKETAPARPSRPASAPATTNEDTSQKIVETAKKFVLMDV